MRILLITSYVPYPPTTGAALRVFNVLQHLSRRHDVSLICFFDPDTEEKRGTAHLQSLCKRVEVIARRKRTKHEHLPRLLRGTLRGEPIRNIFSYYEEMADKIQAITESDNFDIIQIHHSYMAPYINAISPTSQSRRVLVLHNVAYVQYRRMMAVEPNWYAKLVYFLNWLFLKRATLKHARCFDKCIVVSDLDRSLLRQSGLDMDIAAIPGGVDTREYPLLPEVSTTPTLLFVGKMSYGPNIDGAIFFCKEILPLIRQQIPDTKLFIIGREPTSSVRALASDNVVVTGYVDSVIPYYEQAHVSVVPLRAGGGTRLKIPESMALGRPVVSTTLGCEGLSVTHGEDILIADTPSDFAAQTIQLLSDERLRRRLVANGRYLAETTYDWRAVAQRFMEVYERL